MISSFMLKVSAFDEKAPMKWGKISKSEFEVNSFKGDSSVPAIILCDYGTITITNRTIYEHHKRIKIINEKGRKYGKIEIPFAYKENHDDILDFKAAVYEYQNGIIHQTKYRLKDAKRIPLDDNHKLLVLDIPELSPGTIIEYYYKIASLDFVKLNTWYFQTDIPTIWSEIRFEVPEPFFYLATYRRGEFLDKDEQTDFADKLRWLYDANRIQRRSRMARQDHVLYESPSGNYKVFLLNNMKKKIVMKNLPGVSAAEGYVSARDFYPELRFDLYESSGILPWFYRPLLLTATDDYESKSRREWMYSNRMSGYVQYRLDTWNEFNDKLLNNERFGRQLLIHLDNPSLQKYKISNDSSDVSKMEAVFQAVQSSYIWNGRYKVYVDRNLNTIKKGTEAYSGEINLMLVSLLRQSGFDADPVLIRTSNLGQPETEFPVDHQFNHVIAMVSLNGEIYLLDAITQNKSWNELPAEDLHTTGWRVSKNDFGWVDINPR